MDALSTSVSSFNITPALHFQSRELCNFKARRTSSHHQILHPNLSSSSSTRRHSFSSFTSRNSSNPPLLLSSSGSATPSPYSTIKQQKPSTGYAAALLDIALSSNSLKSVAKDAKKFAKLLRNKQVHGILNDLQVGEKEKGEVVRELAEKGRFQKHLVALLKMLVEKKRVGIIGEVMEEFERIYDEFCGTKVVLVSSAKKMEEDQLFGIAQRVQKLSGAVNVKVRNLIGEDLPSFAV